MISDGEKEQDAILWFTKAFRYWERCRVRGLNSRPTVYKTAALPLS
jgi:hypothetical protein